MADDRSLTPQVAFLYIYRRIADLVSAIDDLPFVPTAESEPYDIAHFVKADGCYYINLRRMNDEPRDAEQIAPQRDAEQVAPQRDAEQVALQTRHWLAAIEERRAIANRCTIDEAVNETHLDSLKICTNTPIGWRGSDSSPNRNSDFSPLNIYRVTERLKAVIASELFEVVDEDLRSAIRAAVQELWAALGTADELVANGPRITKAVQRLAICRARLEDCSSRLALKAFGVWGAWWFGQIKDCDHSEIDKMAMSTGPKRCPTDNEILATWATQGMTDTRRETIEAFESRDKWIYERVMQGVTYREIREKLKSISFSNGWSRIGSNVGIKDAAVRYATENNLPLPPPRPPGRPSRNRNQ